MNATAFRRQIPWFSVWFAAVFIVACSAATGGDDAGDGARRDTGGRLDGSGDGAGNPDGRGDGASNGDGPLMCADMRVPCNGTCCGAATSCAGGFCCEETARCGGVCCGPSTRCESGACVLDCGTRVRCGSGSTEACCETDQVCYLDRCATPGPACSDLMRCPDTQYCEPTLRRCLPRDMSGEACEYRPPVGAFNPRLKWQWNGDAMAFPTHTQVMMQPVVANLNDDNGDGRINRDDIPDVVFSTFAGSDYWGNGIVRAISGANGSRLWPSAADPGYRSTPGSSIAIAELDAASPGPEIVTCSASTPSTNRAGHVLILGADGHLIRAIMGVNCGHSAPAIGDMDNDTTPEIVVRNIAFHADGTILPGFRTATPEITGTSVNDFAALSDMNGDGTLEIVLGTRAIRVDGTNLWTRTDVNGYPAIADLNGDMQADVAVVQSGTHSVIALNGQTGATLWGPVEVNRFPTPNGPSGGGPPTIADFDGDGTPDVATAGGYNYLVLNGRTGVPIWFNPSRDTSSRVTGSSVFDFEGDGRAEVVYNDELQLRVYRGTDGMVIFNACSTSGTLWEYPVIVDVDNDDHADIVVMANNYAFPTCMDGTPSPTGIRVYSDPTGNWVRTRRIWNQHTYHVTNVDEDGNIPMNETRNWTLPNLNNFRQNVQPDGLFDAPDLQAADIAADLSMCPASMSLRVRVVNRGRAGAPAGIPVTFYYGDPMGMHTRIGRGVTTRRLLPGEGEVVSISFPLPPGRERETFNIYVIINDPMDMPLEGLHECRPMNNTSVPRPFACSLPG